MIGDRLRLARKRAGLTIQELAERLTPNVPEPTLRNYEENLARASQDTQLDLCKALDVTLEYLHGGRVAALRNMEWRQDPAATEQERAEAEVLVFE